MIALDNIRLPRLIFLGIKQILQGYLMPVCLKKYKLLSMVISGNNIAMKFYFGSSFQIEKSNAHKNKTCTMSTMYSQSRISSILYLIFSDILIFTVICFVNKLLLLYKGAGFSVFIIRKMIN